LLALEIDAVAVYLQDLSSLSMSKDTARGSN
jgi:hypothetical protein